ncbi:GNAT family N-acetyltransferase [Haloarcula taiwanensis]|uniref:GNAT family N-acetyltransferase n=2 Tax=Haloarculaceae TaxID=1963268 RepID=A0A2H5A281_9EURY|nr:GNAT family N-acetyltransferase [Haloarcula taiwanensis]RLM37302.1 GNAT family N-acetyltransferase [Haloarcula sp. Atlit-120R]RLM45215.1 GNAT family N-acetyltransferase [Haloarcula sp. Atlit-47R]RLN01996.1 GNAT family N-acetyltransferase [Haloarcula sp. Atlit-7R]
MDDVDTIVDLWVRLAESQRAHGSHLFGDRNRTAVRETVVQRIVAENVCIARIDRHVVGFVMVTIDSGRYEQDKTRGIIENIFVEPVHRNRGIGSELLDTAEELLRQAGADILALEAMADNESARQLYRAHGYTPHRIELEKPTENDTL